MGSLVMYTDISIYLLFVLFGNCFIVVYTLGCYDFATTPGSYYVPRKTIYNVNEEITSACYGRRAHYIGSRTRKCLPNGTWSGSLLYCGCLKPAFPLDGTFRPVKEFYNVMEIVQYECHTKRSYVYLFGNSSRTCLQNGTWSGVLPYCRSQKKLDYYEHDQYLVIDNRTDTCLRKNQFRMLFSFSGSFRTITVQIISNSGIDYYEVYYGSHHDAQQLFSLHAIKYIGTADLFSQWYSYNSRGKLKNHFIEIRLNACQQSNICKICEVSVFTSITTSCPSITIPNNNTYITYDPSFSDYQHSFGYGSAATFSCKSGFHLKGINTRHCQENNKWTGEKIACEASGCLQEPPAVKNGIWPDWKNGTLYNINAVLQVICRPGYEHFYGQPLTTTCSIQGTWSNQFSEESCQPILCSQQPPDLKNAIWANWESSTTYYFNHTLEAICKSGYINYDQPIVTTCSSEGIWSNSLDEDRCQEIRCSAPSQAIDNSYWSTKDSNESFPLGTQIEVVCKHGYRRSGVLVNITCISMGNWSLSDVECIAIEKPSHNTQNVVIAVAVSCLLLVSLCFGFSIFWTRRRNARRSQERTHQTVLLLENPIYKSFSSDLHLQKEEHLTENNSVDSIKDSTPHSTDESVK